MPVIKGLGWTFDTVASGYDKMRPGYVDALYEAIFGYKPLDASSCALEVGIGAGQATLPVLRTGCRVTAVEPGGNFSALCREKFRDYPGFSVITGKFEEVELERDVYDLVYSASAFHWVPEEVGYNGVYAILKKGGAFARFANHPHPDKGRPALNEEIQALYDRYYYPFHNKKRTPLKEYGEEEAKARAMIAQKYGFSDIRWAMFYRTRNFTASEYIALLGTYSDHIAMEQTVREAFYTGIEDAINRHGGEITIYDTIDLQLARKP